MSDAAPTPTRRDRWRLRYGASPVHLLLHAAGIGAAAFALAQALDPRAVPSAGRLLLWLLGGAVVHDLVLLPAYVAADGALRRLAAALRPAGGPPAGVPLRGHVRIPAAIAGAVLLVHLPSVLGEAPRGRLLTTGHPPPDFAGRWLLLAAGLAAASAVVYGARVARAQGRTRCRTPAAVPMTSTSPETGSTATACGWRTVAARARSRVP